MIVFFFVLLGQGALANPYEASGTLDLYVRKPENQLSFRSPAALGKSLQRSNGDFGHSAMRASCKDSKGKMVKIHFSVQGDMTAYSKLEREQTVVTETDARKIADSYSGETQSKRTVRNYFNECKNPSGKAKPVVLRFKINPGQCDNIRDLHRHIRKRGMSKNFSLQAHPFCGLKGANPEHKKNAGGVCATMSFSFLQAALPEYDSKQRIISKSTRDIHIPKTGWLNWAPKYGAFDFMFGNRKHSKIQVLAPQDLYKNLKPGILRRMTSSSPPGCYLRRFDISDRKAPDMAALARRCQNGPGEIVRNPGKTHGSTFARSIAERVRRTFAPQPPGPVAQSTGTRAPGLN